MVLLFFAPESPWWLLRRGRKQEALRNIKRLGYNTEVGANEAFAMMERTVEIEAHAGGSPTLLDLWKGVDLRRTIITCLVYASQNFAGNLIANQATFFFERAGMDVSIPLRCTESPDLETNQAAHRQTSPSSSA
jgi:SP family general alpha glucoside:H+ symporter-like MFS transporter